MFSWKNDQTVKQTNKYQRAIFDVKWQSSVLGGPLPRKNCCLPPRTSPLEHPLEHRILTFVMTGTKSLLRSCLIKANNHGSDYKRLDVCSKLECNVQSLHAKITMQPTHRDTVAVMVVSNYRCRFLYPSVSPDIHGRLYQLFLPGQRNFPQKAQRFRVWHIFGAYPSLPGRSSNW